jgi:serine/threonine protein kinase/tetratricopeptide (TPR) repeat protein
MPDEIEPHPDSPAAQPSRDAQGPLEGVNQRAPIEAGLPTGTGLGKYRIAERIGASHNCVVYRARDTMLDRLVVIKQMSPELIDHPIACGQFRREAQLLARIPKNAQHIVHVHELIEDQVGLFLVEEYVPGDWLETLISKRKVGAAEATVLLRTAATGLRTLHGHHIVHRGVEPGNIRVTRKGSATLANFASAAHEGDYTRPPSLTPRYAAPELILDQRYDDRVDLHALGMTLWEVCVGRRAMNAYFGKMLSDPLAAIGKWVKWQTDLSQRLPAASELNPLVPVDLSSILDRMTAKRLDDRYASIDELLGDIARLLPAAPHKPATRFGFPSVSTAGATAAINEEARRVWIREPSRSDWEPPRSPVYRTATRPVEQVASMPRRRAVEPAGRPAPNVRLSRPRPVWRDGSSRRARQEALHSSQRLLLPVPPLIVREKRRPRRHTLRWLVAAALMVGAGVWGGKNYWIRFLPTAVHPIERLLAEGRAAYDANRFVEARQKLRQASTMSVEGPRLLAAHADAERLLLLLEARAHIEKSEFSPAEEYLRQAERWGADPNYVSHLQQQLWSKKDAIRAAGDSYDAIAAGDFSRAALKADEYERHATLAGMDPEQLRATLQLSRQDERYRQAITDAREALLRSDFERANLLCGEAESIRFSTETRELRKLIADSKKRQEWIAIADAAMLEKDYARAVQAYEKAAQVAVSPDIELKARTARAYLFLEEAKQRIAADDLVGGEEKLKASLWNAETREAQNRLDQLGPRFDAARALRDADRAIEAREFERALKVLEQASARLPPEIAESLKPKLRAVQRAWALDRGDRAVDAGDLEAAMRAYEEARAINPGEDVSLRMAIVQEAKQKQP